MVKSKGEGNDTMMGEGYEWVLVEVSLPPGFHHHCWNVRIPHDMW